MQLYCSLPPKNVVWNFLISVVEAVTAIVTLIMQHETQGAYLLIQRSRPSYCNSEGREGRARAQEDPASQALRGHSLRRPVSSWHTYWGPCVSSCLTLLFFSTSIARPVQESRMLRSEQSTLQWALKATHEESFHEDQGLQEPVGFRFGVVLLFFYFKFQQERCAMFQ
jgi:hypothetical protein